MARAPVIDADGHSLERQEDVRKYLEPPWDQRRGGLWEGSYPWDTELHGTLTNHDYRDGDLETLLPEVARHIGDDHFLFASDVPHWDARFPENLEFLESREDIPEESLRKIVYGNAKRLFGL